MDVVLYQVLQVSKQHLQNVRVCCCQSVLCRQCVFVLCGLHVWCKEENKKI